MMSEISINPVEDPAINFQFTAGKAANWIDIGIDPEKTIFHTPAQNAVRANSPLVNSLRRQSHETGPLRKSVVVFAVIVILSHSLPGRLSRRSVQLAVQSEHEL